MRTRTVVDVQTGTITTVPLTPEEIALIRDTSVEDAAKNRLERIADLENKQARAVREAVLTGDKTKLQAIEDQIATLRSTS